MGKSTSIIQSYLDWFIFGEPARWRYLLGALLVLGAWLGGPVALLLLLSPVLPALRQATTVGGLAMQGLASLAVLAALWVVLKLLHKRPLWTAGFPHPQIEWANLGLGTGAGLLAAGVMIGFYVLSGTSRVVFQAPRLGSYLPFALLALPVLLLQAATRELVFRGYLTQAARRFTALPPLYLLLPALLYTIPRLITLTARGESWSGALTILASGLALGWLAYRSRSLWMSTGVHWASSLSLVLLYAIQDPGQTLTSQALLQFSKPPNPILIAASLALNLLLALGLTWVISLREKRQRERL